MKSSTLTANQHIADALESIEKAERSLRITGELGPNWLMMEALGRTKEAKQSVQTAGAYVAELLESEDAE